MKEFFIKTYGEVDYIFTNSEEEDIITNYKNRYKIDKEIKINEIINLDKQIQIAIGYINRLYN